MSRSIKPRPYISQLQEEFLEGNRRLHPCHTNRASECGHPCARYLFYARTRWEDRQVPSVSTQAIFELGKDLERIVTQNWLQDRLRLEVVAPKHQDFHYPALELTGHMDAYVEEEINEQTGEVSHACHVSDPDPMARSTAQRLWVPVEIKGINLNTWRELGDFNDLLKSKRHWVRKWAGQLLMYLVMDDKPYGRFVFFSKELGQIKDIPVVRADYQDVINDIVARLEMVNKCVREGITPDRFYEPGPPDEICVNCNYNHICLPGGSYEEALSVVDNPVIEEALDKWKEMEGSVHFAKAEVKEYDELRKKLRAMLKGKDHVRIGKYIVSGKMRGGRYPYWQWEAKEVDE